MAAAPASNPARQAGLPRAHLRLADVGAGAAPSPARACGDLIREEVAAPLNTDGLHLGRPPADCAHPAGADHPPAGQPPATRSSTWSRRGSAAPVSRRFGVAVLPRDESRRAGRHPVPRLRDPRGERRRHRTRRWPGCTARSPTAARSTGRSSCRAELRAGLTGRPSLRPDRSVFMPLSFHLGYHSLPIPRRAARIRSCRARRIGGLGRSRASGCRSGSCTTGC